MADSGSDSFSSTLAGGCDYVFDFCCDLCEQDGIQKEANGYCSDCQDYLCKECYHHHTRPRPMRHHVLLDQHQMPKDKQQNRGSDTCKENRKTRAQHVTDINVKSWFSSTSCITGCVVLPGDKLVLVDKDNSKVKLVDLTQNNLVSQLKLPGDIWDIAQVSSKEVAVTSSIEQTIYFVIASDKLKLDRKVKVKGHCMGITNINDNLVVSYAGPVKVEIISMEGEVLQTVVTEDKGRQLFTYPWYVAVSKDQQTIYISDYNRHTVTSVALTGQVLATYKDDKLRWPLGLTVDTAGTVYVCGWSSNSILQLTADLTEVQVLLQQSDGVVDHWSICYCETTDRLYIGMEYNDVVKVYQLK